MRPRSHVSLTPAFPDCMLLAVETIPHAHASRDGYVGLASIGQFPYHSAPTAGRPVYLTKLSSSSHG
jgi:hypothetical protein